MRVSNFVMGLMLLGLSVAILLYAQTLPNPARQRYGPDAFPSIVAGMMGIASLLLIWQGRNEGAGRWGVSLAPWTHDIWSVTRFLLVPASVLFYIYTVNYIGFIGTSTIVLLVLFLSLRVTPWAALANAVAIPLVVHTAFYMVLGVQLPWGLLAPIRW